MFIYPSLTCSVLLSIRFHIPEVLFQPHLHGFDTLVGVHSLVNSSICRVDANVRSQLYKNIVVAGGNTMFPGFVDRLKAEMVALAPANTTVSLVAPSDRHIATWLGGSILSSLSIFKEMLVTKEEYDEKGASSMRQSERRSTRPDLYLFSVPDCIRSLSRMAVRKSPMVSIYSILHQLSTLLTSIGTPSTAWSQ